jgi:hypothetical protein
MKRFSLFLILLSMAAASCYYDNLSELHPPGTETCDSTGTVTYNNQVSAIFESYCGTNGGCHSSGIANGGVILESYQEAFVVDDNDLIAAIEHTGSDPVKYMPQGGSKLSDCNIGIIKKWIATGKTE